MKFRTPLLISLALIVAFGEPVRALAIQFSDLTGSGYDRSIMALAQAGVVTGYPDGTVQPFFTLNRAEALKVIFVNQSHLKTKAESIARSMPPLPLFGDIDQRAWYAPYVEAGFEAGIVKGYHDGLFRPGRTLTVEEAIALLLRSYGVQGETQFMTSSFLSNTDGQWYTPFVSAAHRRNLIASREVLRVGQPITRGQFFDMVYRMREVKSRGLTAYVETDVDRRPVGSPVPTTQPVPSGSDPMARQYASAKPFAITLPTLGITDLSIIHPSDPFTSEGVLSVLGDGVGHLFSYPGEGGKIMVYGHSSGYPWDISQYTKIFRRINELNVGDRAYVTYAGKLYVYEVTREQTIAVEDSRPFEPDGNGEELILYTCWPPDTVDERYLVHLKPVATIKI